MTYKQKHRLKFTNFKYLDLILLKYHKNGLSVVDTTFIRMLNSITSFVFYKVNVVCESFY